MKKKSKKKKIHSAIVDLSEELRYIVQEHLDLGYTCHPFLTKMEGLMAEEINNFFKDNKLYVQLGVEE
jgi:hypothetical protein